MRANRFVSARSLPASGGGGTVRCPPDVSGGPVKISVESAALLHHSPVETLPHAIDGEALVPALLRAFHHAANAPKHLQRLAEIIHIPNRFDELYELRATEP